MIHFTLQQASCSAIPDIKRIATNNKEALGFLSSAKVKDAIYRHNLLTIRDDNKVLGFVIYRHRKRDQQTTLYDICVDKEWRKQGLGRQLIEALKTECQNQHRSFVQLKCPVDLAANSFYKHLGFRHLGIEQGKIRQLNVWHLPLEENI